MYNLSLNLKKMKSQISIFLVFFAVTAEAQNYLISFIGTGASTSVSTVKVENLTTGNNLEINGSDILRLTISTEVISTSIKQSNDLNIYPNPMINNSKIQFIPHTSGNSEISVFDITGAEIISYHLFLENCLHEFQISNLKAGVYVVSAKGNNWKRTGFLISQGSSIGTTEIVRISSNSQVEVGKNTLMISKGQNAIIDMPYSIGDRLKFTGRSGIYSTITTDVPTQDKAIIFNFIQCTDVDNNNYPIVQIGTQIWMAENLRTTHYRNFNTISTTDPPSKDISGETYPRYQWAFAGNESNVSTYGRLYTIFAAQDVRGVCPTGWHLPTDDEWTTLINYLGGESVAGGKVKETGTNHWSTPNTGASNESGFTAVPAGIRQPTGEFYAIGYNNTLWSRTDFDANTHWTRFLPHNAEYFSRIFYPNKHGFSVRCLKD